MLDHQHPPVVHVDWFSPNIPALQKHLGHLAGKPHLKFLEIGCFEGWSSWWMLTEILSHDTSRLVCVDLFLESFGPNAELGYNINPTKSFRSNVQAANAMHRVEMLKGESVELLTRFPRGHFDSVYVDGDHRAPHALTDIILSWRALKKNGVMVIDDYLWKRGELEPHRRPEIAVDAFLEVFAGHYTLLHQDWQVILKKTREL